MSLIPTNRDELRGLIIRRNEIAFYLQNYNKLPPTLKNPHPCNHCHLIGACTLYHKVIEIKRYFFAYSFRQKRMEQLNQAKWEIYLNLTQNIYPLHIFTIF